MTLAGHVKTFERKHAADMGRTGERRLGHSPEIEVRLAFDTRRSDFEITAAANARLALDVSIPRDAVAVNVQNGWITLTGELNWPFQQEAAERDILPLYGVIGVSNQTVIVPIVTAQNIADDIMHALHRSWFLNPEAITASAEGGTVQLTGAVRSALDRQFAGNSPRQPHGWRPARPPSTTTSSFDESAAARAPTAAAH